MLWRFARPHTVIGTALSVVGLYAIAVAEPARRRRRRDLLATLIAGLTVNIAIVGVNQITDVEIDRINKPCLPIAAGDLSLGGARGDRRRRARVVPLAMALTQGAVGDRARSPPALAVGALYSLPPFRLKRFPVAASLCITGRAQPRRQPRRLLALRAATIDPPVWALCLFVLPFSFAIAVLKDVPGHRGRPRGTRSARSRSGSAPERVFRHRPGGARRSPTPA